MNILLVEDNYVTRLLIKKTLKNIGYTVIEAVDGRQAWDICKSQSPDMVVTDWIMPKMDGIELCRRIRERNTERYCYIIVQTAKEDIADLIHVFDAGADDYMIKPIRPGELTSRIKTGERLLRLQAEHYRVKEMLTVQNKELDLTLTRLKQTQSYMLQSEKMASIGQLAAGIAHEINNPLGFISSNLDALSDYMSDITTLLSEYKKLLDVLKGRGQSGIDDALDRQIETVSDAEEQMDIDYLVKDIFELVSDCKEGTGRVAGIINDLKHFARPGNEGRMLVDINKGIQSTLNVIRNEIKYKAEVETDFGDVDLVDGYPQKLNMVFMNILLNAAQAIEKTGNILVRTRQDDEHVIVQISDTGCGIEEDHLVRIFEPFFTTKELGTGTGLGMNIAYNIVKEHNGAIEVESRIGKGSCFTVTLPREAGDERP